MSIFRFVQARFVDSLVSIVLVVFRPLHHVLVVNPLEKAIYKNISSWTMFAYFSGSILISFIHRDMELINIYCRQC
jgi:hypothetical protein